MSNPTSLPPDSELLSLQTSFTQHLRNPTVMGSPRVSIKDAWGFIQISSSTISQL